MGSQKQLQDAILNYLNEEGNTEENYQNIINLMYDLNIQNDINEFRLFLHLVDNISNYHYRTKNFISKIERILLSVKDRFTKLLTNSEIFIIFKNNKRILLFLIENNILYIDQYIEDNMNDLSKENYPLYFQNKINTESKLDEQFITNQRNGENEQIFCQYIRLDMISDFITYVNQTGKSLNSQIKPSIFETNQFLLNKNPTLIEYSAFFGSIQIFTYLYKNKIELTSSLWVYSIHGLNSDIIKILVENKIKPENDSYEKCLEEAIKCHHNDIVLYIKENIIENETINIDKLIEMKSINYYNFAFFPDYYNRNNFYYFCKFDYYILVENYLKNKEFDINFTISDSSNEFSFICTPLLISIIRNNFNVVELLLKQPNADVNTEVIFSDWSKKFETSNALIFTVINNNPNMTKLLLYNCNINVNSSVILKDKIENDQFQIDEYYPLHEAIMSDNNVILKLLLLKNDIDVNVKQKVSHFSGDGSQCSLLEKKTCLQSAIENTNINAIKLLLNNPNIDVNKYSTFYQEKKNIKQTPLNAAIVSKEVEIAKSLLKHPNIDVNKISIIINDTKTIMKTPLNAAISINNYKLTKLLLKNPNIDVNKITTIVNNEKTIKNTPLILAIIKNDYKIIELLLKHQNIDVNIPLVKIINKNEKEEYQSPLNLAIKNNDLKIVKLLLSHPNIDVNKLSILKLKNIETQQSPLSLAIKLPNSDIVSLLLSNNNINVNLQVTDFIDKQKIKENPLTIATHLNQNEIVKLLLVHKNINVNTKYIIKNKKETANEQYIEKNSLFLAIENKNETIVKLLLSHPDIDVNCKLITKNNTNLNTKQEALLHSAISQNNIEIVKNLLDNSQIDVNIKSFEKYRDFNFIKEIETPTLYHAVLYKNMEIIQLLLSRKDLDLSDQLKNTFFKSENFFIIKKTALHLAVTNNDWPIFQYLFNFLRKNRKLTDNLHELMKIATDDKIKSFLYDEINNQN